jgi:hypothetical protein
MNLERIDEIIAKNITITDKRLYEGVFNAVLEAVNEENEACAKVAESYEPRCEVCPGGVSNAIRARVEV